MRGGKRPLDEFNLVFPTKFLLGRVEAREALMRSGLTLDEAEEYLDADPLRRMEIFHEVRKRAMASKGSLVQRVRKLLPWPFGE